MRSPSGSPVYIREFGKEKKEKGETFVRPPPPTKDGCTLLEVIKVKIFFNLIVYPQRKL
jgi:hypothetical protein